MNLKSFIFCVYLLLAFEGHSQPEINIIKANQYDLSKRGKQFIMNEAQRASFLLLGELHGEQEIPDLIFTLWTQLHQIGYNHIAAEVSPWAAQKLEFGIGNDSLKKEVLWSNREAKFVHLDNATIVNPTIWGCDMEEISVDKEIALFAQINYSDIITKAAFMARDNYSREKASSILRELTNYHPKKDSLFNGISLYDNIKSSLIIDSLRALPEEKLEAQMMRENLMKKYFLTRYNNLTSQDGTKIFFRFGRNHLHKGFDDRGISTLGNFVTEFAFSKGLKSFNIAAFAAGGKYTLLGETDDADETGDDIALAFFSKQADYNETIFDLRPLRIVLHRTSSNQRSDLQKRLLYWADSYDAIICYKKVTPFYH